MLNKNTWGVKKVRGQEEPATITSFSLQQFVAIKIQNFKFRKLIISIDRLVGYQTIAVAPKIYKTFYRL